MALLVSVGVHAAVFRHGAYENAKAPDAGLTSSLAGRPLFTDPVGGTDRHRRLMPSMIAFDA